MCARGEKACVRVERKWVGVEFLVGGRAGRDLHRGGSYLLISVRVFITNLEISPNSEMHLSQLLSLAA